MGELAQYGYEEQHGHACVAQAEVAEGGVVAEAEHAKAHRHHLLRVPVGVRVMG